MGSRVEYVLILAISIVLLIPFVIDIDSSKNAKTAAGNKSSELNNFIEYEINATKLQHTLKASKAEQIKENWHLNSVEIKTDKLKSVKANSAIVKPQKIELNKNVVAVKQDGTIYKSQKAVYDKKSKELITPENFTITRKVDIVKGKKLEYISDKNITKAKDVNATFVLKKAKN